jgi:hypothetical protein
MVTNVMTIIVGSPVTPVTNTVVFEGDFEDVVGTNKNKFLEECTILLSENGALDVECIDVRPGSIIVVVSG